MKSLIGSLLLPSVILFSWSSSALEMFPGDRCYDYQEGTIRVGYLQSVVMGDALCTTGVQTCLNGMWMGPIIYSDCQQINKNCDGQPHGTVIHGFLEPYTIPGMECVPATRLCNNGTWEGPAMIYPSCFKEP